MLQYFYLSGTSVGYLDKSKINILVTFFKKSISQKRFDCFVMFLVFVFVTISGNLTAPLVNYLGQRLRISPSREEKMNSICIKRHEMCPSLNFNDTFPYRPDPSVLTPEIYNVDYIDLTVKIPLECYLEAHIDLQLGNFSEIESELLMTGTGYENSRQVLRTHILVVLSGTSGTEMYSCTDLCDLSTESCHSCVDYGIVPPLSYTLDSLRP